MDVQAIFAGAVKISWQGGECAFDIWRAASDVIPRIANVRAAAKTVKMGRIERQWIAITLCCSIQRHARVDAVVQRALDRVGELGFAACR